MNKNAESAFSFNRSIHHSKSLINTLVDIFAKSAFLFDSFFELCRHCRHNLYCFIYNRMMLGSKVTCRLRHCDPDIIGSRLSSVSPVPISYSVIYKRIVPGRYASSRTLRIEKNSAFFHKTHKFQSVTKIWKMLKADDFRDDSMLVAALMHNFMYHCLKTLPPDMPLQSHRTAHKKHYNYNYQSCHKSHCYRRAK